MPRPPIQVLTRTPCPECGGDGVIAGNHADVKADDAEEIACGDCGGTGYKDQWRRIASGAIHVQDRP